MCSSKKCCCNKSKGISIGLILFGVFIGLMVMAWKVIEPIFHSLLLTASIMTIATAVFWIVVLVLIIRHEGFGVVFIGDRRDFTPTTPITAVSTPLMGVAASSAPVLAEPGRAFIEPPSAIPARLVPYALTDMHHEYVIEPGWIK
jgi:hypothetical protein